MTLTGGRERQLHDGLSTGVNSKNDRFANFGGEFVAHLANGVSDVIGSFHHVLLKFEKHLNVGVAFVGCAAQIFDTVDRLHGLLYSVEHFSLNRVRRCAGITDVDDQQWQVDVGNLIDLEFVQCQKPYGHEHEQNNDSDNRFFDAEIRQEHVLLTYFGACVCAQGEGLSIFQRTAVRAQ